MAAAAGFDDHATRALANLACQAVEWCDFALAEDVLERVIGFAGARDLDGYVRHLLGYRAVLRLARGDWAGARADAEDAMAGPAQPGPFRCRAQVALGLLRSRTGDPRAGGAAGDAAQAAYEAGELQFVGPVAAALAEHFWLAGRAGPVGRRGPARVRARDAGRAPLVRRAARLLAVAGGGVGGRFRTASRQPYRLLIDGRLAGGRRPSGAARGAPTPGPRRWPAATTQAVAEALRIAGRARRGR